MRNLRTALAMGAIMAILLTGCAGLPLQGRWTANPQTGVVVLQTTPWDGGSAAGAVPAATTSAPAVGPAGGIPAAGNGLRYDNAGQQYDDGRFDSGCEYPGVGLAPGQTETVAYRICHSNLVVNAWIAIQAQAAAANATTLTASAGTELTEALPLGVAWVIWQSTCSIDPTKVDLSVPSRDLAGPGCIGFMPPYGAGDRTINFEQAIAVH